MGVAQRAAEGAKLFELSCLRDEVTVTHGVVDIGERDISFSTDDEIAELMQVSDLEAGEPAV